MICVLINVNECGTIPEETTNEHDADIPHDEESSGV